MTVSASSSATVSGRGSGAWRAESHAEKTAALFSATCWMAAILGHEDRRGVHRWTAFGEHLGMAFQIIDDVFDFVAQEREIGTPVGNDLREGHVTLPMIGALERSPAGERTRILELIRRGDHLNGCWDDVVEFVRQPCAFGFTG